PTSAFAGCAPCSAPVSSGLAAIMKTTVIKVMAWPGSSPVTKAASRRQVWSNSKTPSPVRHQQTDTAGARRTLPRQPDRDRLMSDPLYLYNLIDQRLADDADATAFSIDGKNVSVAAFDQLCRRLDSWLGEQGIGEGDVVAVWLVNRLEWLALLFALARRGATLAAINTRYRREEVQDILQRSGARLLVMQSVFRNIAFAEVLSQVDGATLPTLEKIVLLDEGDLPATLIGKPVIALDSERPAASGHGHTEAESGVILFTTS